MRRVTVTFVVLAAFFFASLQAALLPPFPATTVFWSGDRYFTSNQEQCLTTISEVEIGEFISSVSGPATKNVLSAYVSSAAQRPEVVVIFVEKEAQPSREAYSFLQAFVDSAASSLVVPYTYPNARVSDVISNQISHAAILSDDAVLRYFDNQRAILSDGKTNVVVVTIAGGDASLIRAVEQQLSGSSYLIGYVADASYRAPEKSTRMVTLSTLDSDLVVEHTYGGEYWPADVWSGIVISVTLLVMLAIGIGCMFELQTPTRWEKTKRTIREIN